MKIEERVLNTRDTLALKQYEMSTTTEKRHYYYPESAKAIYNEGHGISMTNHGSRNQTCSTIP